jgi:hypothetical protein
MQDRKLNSTYDWFNAWHEKGAVIKIGPKGNIGEFTKRRPEGLFHELSPLKQGTDWSAPLKLGKIDGGAFGTLAVDQDGGAFAAWLKEEGCFVGRWIRLRGSTHKEP